MTVINSQLLITNNKASLASYPSVLSMRVFFFLNNARNTDGGKDFALLICTHWHIPSIFRWERLMGLCQRLKLGLAVSSSERSSKHSWWWIWQFRRWVCLCFFYHTYCVCTCSQTWTGCVRVVLYYVYQATHIWFPSLPRTASSGENAHFTSRWIQRQYRILDQWSTGWVQLGHYLWR